MKFLSVAGDRLTILLDGKDTAGTYTVMEGVLRPGAGPPPHVHRREDEGFLVMVGEVTFFLGDEMFVFKPGEYLFAPRGIPHHFKNTGTSEAIVFETPAPAGIEQFFEAVGTPLLSREGAPVAFSPEALAHMIAIAPQFGIDILVPKSNAGAPAYREQFGFRSRIAFRTPSEIAAVS